MKKHELSVQQKALWYHNKLYPTSHSFNIGFAFKMVGVIDESLFIKALNDIYKHHEILGAVFNENTEDGLYQTFVHNNCQTEILNILEEQLTTHLINKYREPFDLTDQNPKVKTYLFRVSNKYTVFLFVAHHIIFDFFSARLLLNELLQQYTGYILGKVNGLVAPTDSHSSFVSSQQKVIEHDKEMRLFWRRYFDNCDEFLKLPGDNKVLYQQKVIKESGDVIIQWMDTTLADTLFDFAANYNTTVFNILLAFFELLLYRYTGKESFIVGSPFLGRERKFLSTVGYFANILPLKCNIDKNLTLLSFLKANAAVLQEVQKKTIITFRGNTEMLHRK